MKNSPEWNGPPKGDNVVVTPYSQLADLHIHVKGYTRDGKRFEAHRGNGNTSFFYKIPYTIATQKDVDNKAGSIALAFKMTKEMVEQEARADKEAKKYFFKSN